MPPAVATDSIVRVVKEKFDFSKAKFVNALMHEIEKFDVERALKRLKEKDRIEWLSVRFSHPPAGMWSTL